MMAAPQLINELGTSPLVLRPWVRGPSAKANYLILPFIKVNVTSFRDNQVKPAGTNSYFTVPENRLSFWGS